MKFHEAKQASSEALRRSRNNGDQVEKIMQEADAVEGEVRRIIRQFTQRLQRYRTRMLDRANAAAATEDDEAGDESATERDLTTEESEG